MGVHVITKQNKIQKFKKLSVKLKKSHHSSISKPHIKFISFIPTVWSIKLKWLQLTQFQNSLIKVKCVIHDSK